MFTLTHEGRIYANFTEANLLAAGVPQVTVDAAKLETRRRIVSDACRTRILKIVPATTQANMTAAAAVIGAKTASARSDAEKAILTGLEAGLGWITAMRAAYASLAANTEADFTDNANWPACPAEALAVIEQF